MRESRCRCGRESRCRCGRGEPSPGAAVAGASPVPVRMWWGRASPGADVAGASPVPAQMWQGRAQSWCGCGRGEPSPGADVAGASPVPVRMWQGRFSAPSHVSFVSKSALCSRREAAHETAARVRVCARSLTHVCVRVCVCVCAPGGRLRTKQLCDRKLLSRSASTPPSLSLCRKCWFRRRRCKWG
jgi:hypothetical protein